MFSLFSPISRLTRTLIVGAGFYIEDLHLVPALNTNEYKLVKREVLSATAGLLPYDMWSFNGR